MPLMLPPYGKQLVVPDLPILFLFTGEPDCWHHAKQQIESGFNNFLCLPSADDAGDYRWPVAGCTVIVIVFGDISARTESYLLAVLCHFEPIEIIIRHWPNTEILIRRRRSS